MKRLTTIITAAILAAAGSTVLCGCASEKQPEAFRAVGGDVSLLPTYEEAGVEFLDSAGTKIDDLMAFFAKEGWNTIRVRLFVNPENAPQQAKDEGVYQNIDYVTTIAEKVKKAGMKLMLDFHYSDTWADPGKQFTPKAWATADTASAEYPKILADSVYRHTKKSLEHLKQHGISPEYIQVGNETSYGMLWPTGKVNFESDDNWEIFANLNKAGSKACREICPDAKIILHTERAGEQEKTLQWYQQMKKFDVDYDIIGLSYYPMWHKDIPTLDSTLTAITDSFPGKDIMIVETAYFYTEHKKWEGDLDTDYPFTPEGQKQFTDALIDMLHKHANVIGLFWWCPEENCHNNDVLKFRMNRGLFNNDTGKALPALYELKKF